MAVQASFLSDAKYGYDFVVVTTQASLNSGLLEYMYNDKQPVTQLFLLADPDTGDPYVQISLGDLLERTKGEATPRGVNPFDIPAGTGPSDARVHRLTQQRFIYAFEMQIGIPPGVLLKDLPFPILDLCDSVNNVLFTMYCSQFRVIQNLPPNSFGGGGSWNIWTQDSGNPWYIQARVDVKIQGLDKSLNRHYFDNFPEKKQAILNQLNNHGDTAFSLLQLFLDFDSVVVQGAPVSKVPVGSKAELMLRQAFVEIYSKSAKEFGQPLLAVQVVAQGADTSTLKLTAFEREVCQLLDDNGSVTKNLSPMQKSATTLAFLCVSGKPFPGVSSFNWVKPTDVEAESGKIAINRTTLAKCIVSQIIPFAQKSCFAVTTRVWSNPYGTVKYNHGMTPGQTPTATYPPTGSTVANLEYSTESSAHDESGATSGELAIKPRYTCDVKFQDTTITVTQRLIVNVYIAWGSTGAGLNAVDTTITDTYNLSIDAHGFF